MDIMDIMDEQMIRKMKMDMQYIKNIMDYEKPQKPENRNNMD